MQAANPRGTPPRELVDRIGSGKCIALVGAGLSRASGIPNWRQALLEIINWSQRKGIQLSDLEQLRAMVTDEASDVLLIAEDLKEQLGPNRYPEVLRDIFRPPGAEPNQAHHLLVKLPFRGFVTTNYDKLLEFAFGSKLPTVCTGTQPAELKNILTQDRFLLKAHGDIDHIETVILGRRDYQSLLQNAAYQQTMATLFATSTVFFVGFSLKDPDLRLIIDKLRATFDHHGVNHYALLPATEVNAITERRYQQDLGVTVIQYNPTESHPEVQKFLAAVTSAIEEERKAREPAARYVLAKDLAHIERQELEKNRDNLTTPQYLMRLASIMRNLRDKGQPDAWEILAGPFEKESASLIDPERMELGIELAALVMADAGALRAAPILHSLLATAERLSPEAPTAFPFWEIWARCLLECYDIDGTIEAIKHAAASAPSDREKQMVHAIASEMNLLAGRLSQAANALRST